MHFHVFASPRRCFAAAFCAALAGCGSPSPQPQARPPAVETAPRETWDVVYMQGKRAGYGRRVERQRSDGSQPVVEIEMESHMSVERFGQTSEVVVKIQSRETPQGRLLSFSSENTLGSSPVTATGQVEGGTLAITTRAAATTVTRDLDWPDEARGFFAPEQALLRKPMQPGERRTLRYLQPILNSLCTEELVARDYESTELLSQTQELLAIDCSLKIEGQPRPMRSVRWTDRKGDTLKTELPALQMATYRATKEQALGEASGPPLDVGLESLVHIDQPLKNSRSTSRVRYRVTLEGGDPAEVFANGSTQRVQSTGPHEAEITVVSLDPRDASCDGNSGPAAAADLAPNSMIQSDDPRIAAMAREASAGRREPVEVALALERYVDGAITDKNYSTAFDTAADVARTLEGDCTEHAVLLAALARASGIPARVAMGLVYSATDQAFAYHMWTEVHLGECWAPLDATLGEGRVPADHIKLTDSDLRDAAGWSSFLSVAEVLGQLQIEVLEAEYGMAADDEQATQ